MTRMSFDDSVSQFQSQTSPITLLSSWVIGHSPVTLQPKKRGRWPIGPPIAYVVGMKMIKSVSVNAPSQESNLTL